MTLVGLIVVLIVLGVIMYLIQDKIAPDFLKIIYVLVVLLVVLWLLSYFGILTGGPTARLE